MKKYLSICISTIFIFICGCGGSGTDTQNYQDPTLMNYKINSIAILPIRNSYISLTESKEINRYFMTGVSRKISKFKIISPDEAIEKLNNDSLVEKYFKYLVQYSSSGIPNTSIVKEVGKSIGADVMIQGEIFGIIKKDGDIWDNTEGKTSCKVRYSMITSIDGNVIWETTTEAYVKTGAFDFDPEAPVLMEVLKEAMDDIIESMPVLKK